MAAIQESIGCFEEQGAFVLGVSNDSFAGVLSMKLMQGIAFPLVSDTDSLMLDKLGLVNPNMNRSPIIAVIGKNMVKYWVYEGTNVVDRPTMDEILGHVLRVNRIYID